MLTCLKKSVFLLIPLLGFSSLPLQQSVDIPVEMDFAQDRTCAHVQVARSPRPVAQSQVCFLGLDYSYALELAVWCVLT